MQVSIWWLVVMGVAIGIQGEYCRRRSNRRTEIYRSLHHIVMGGHKTAAVRLLIKLLAMEGDEL